MMEKYEMQINKDKLVSSKTALAMHELRIYIPSLFWYDKLGGLHTEKNGCYSPYYMCGCPTLLECLQYLSKERTIDFKPRKQERGYKMVAQRGKHIFYNSKKEDKFFATLEEALEVAAQKCLDDLY